MPKPRLRLVAPARPRAVVLVLHGGREHGRRRAAPWGLAYLRMVPFAIDLIRAGSRRGLAVGLLRYRFQGWNAPDKDPVRDASWALERIRGRHPGLPVVLVGHSMGGRVAFRVAGDPSVVAVCGLAPWTEPRDPVEQLSGRSVLIAHGDLDRVTSPAKSRDYADRASTVTDRVRWVDIPGERHAMLRYPRRWRLLVRRFVTETLDMA
jgi:dienelactone hydrolase